RDDQWFASDRFAREVVAELEPRCEGEIELLLPQVGEHVGAEHLSGCDLDLRGVLGECTEEYGERLVGDRERVGEADLAEFAAGGGVGALEYALGDRDGALGFLDEHGPGGGQLDGARRSVEQLHAEHLLDRTYLLAESLLGDVELFGGAGEVALASDGDYVPHLPEVRSHPGQQ